MIDSWVLLLIDSAAPPPDRHDADFALNNIT